MCKIHTFILTEKETKQKGKHTNKQIHQSNKRTNKQNIEKQKLNSSSK